MTHCHATRGCPIGQKATIPQLLRDCEAGLRSISHGSLSTTLRVRARQGFGPAIPVTRIVLTNVNYNTSGAKMLIHRNPAHFRGAFADDVAEIGLGRGVGGFAVGGGRAVHRDG